MTRVQDLPERIPSRRPILIGAQDFVKIRQGGYFYVDKTDFIRRWRLSGADVTLITRPRRFGKTLMMNTVERFFSNAYADQADLFSGLAVWKDAQTRSLAGTFPVVALSFSTLKVATVLEFQNAMMAAVCDIYQRFDGLRNSPALSEEEREFFKRVTRWETEGKQELPAGGERTAVMGTLQIALQKLCLFLHKHYGRKVIVLLDEYDTPMQEAWLHGYWDEISLFMRRLMNATFKDNNHLERGLLTGITRVSKESIFSDLNNIDVITTTSDDYADSFGFTQAEVAEAMAEYGLTDFEGVKRWYDGFTFGSVRDIYNPWSITKFLKTGKLQGYWANTSTNALAGVLIRESDAQVKKDFETLICGGQIETRITEELSFRDLDQNPTAVWSLLLATGYLRFLEDLGEGVFRVALTNHEVIEAFRGLIRTWFDPAISSYNAFQEALLACDAGAMTVTLGKVSEATFSYFDVGGKEPERFYHGFVLGLLTTLDNRFHIRSNRESGFGRYDIVLEPKDSQKDDAFVLEFKIHNPEREKTLEETVTAALEQIREKRYFSELQERGINAARIHAYGFAFCGKKVLVG